MEPMGPMGLIGLIGPIGLIGGAGRRVGWACKNVSFCGSGVSLKQFLRY
jgi:hypothetical protein